VRENDEAAAQERDVDRLVAFSDGVYAIAITLLVLSLSVPNGPNDKLGDELRGLGPQLLSYALSFAVIGRYWVAHHGMFRTLRRVNGPLLALNLVLLGFIALLPFPTQVLGDYGDTTLGTIIYAVTICAVGSLTSLVGWYMVHAGLSTATPPSVVRSRIVHGMVVVVVFAISIPIAVASPEVAKYSWLLIIPAGVFADRLFGPSDE